MHVTLAQLFHWLQVQIPEAQLLGDAAVLVERVHTDTRSIKPGDLFVALKGERFDAHDFLLQAQACGAVAAITSSRVLPDSADATSHSWPQIVVPDTTVALGAIAAAWRQQFTLPLIAVTGSNGKTTVTQMLAAILTAYAGDAALATRGNLNNAIGVPQTLLRMQEQHQIAAVELGMNHPGEIAYLAKLVRPTVAVVNNAQREHMEFMHTVEAVAQENGAVLTFLPPDGVAVFPHDDVYTPLWRELAGGCRVLTFSDTDTQADVYADAHWQGGAWQMQLQAPEEAATVVLALAGRHNVRNALAACACALGAGVPLSVVVQGLMSFVPVQGRSMVSVLNVAGRHLTLVDDTYNANPDSVRAAIAVLAALPHPQCLVLGDMGEVGAQGPQMHTEMGAYARECGIDRLLLLGELARHGVSAFGEGAQHFDSMLDIQNAAVQALLQHSSVLVKGSRFMRMEQVVHAIKAAVTEGQHAGV